MCPFQLLHLWWLEVACDCKCILKPIYAKRLLSSFSSFYQYALQNCNSFFSAVIVMAGEN